MRRTGGGHRRIPVSGVIQYIRESGQSLARPELLGLPHSLAPVHADADVAVSDLARLLIAGDEPAVRSLILGLYLSKRPLADIFDAIVHPAFGEIGHAWECGRLQVYREHRAVEIAMRLLHEIRRLLTPPREGATVAVGATLERDPYTLAMTMAELVLRDRGWHAESLGPNHPVDTLVAALDDYQPSLLWLNVSYVDNPVLFLERYSSLHEAARDRDVSIVVGGLALAPELRRQMRYTAFCETMGHLEGLADSLE